MYQETKVHFTVEQHILKTLPLFFALPAGNLIPNSGGMGRQQLRLMQIHNFLRHIRNAGFLTKCAAVNIAEPFNYWWSDYLSKMTFMQPELQASCKEMKVQPYEATVTWKNIKLTADPSESSKGTSALC